MNFASDNTAPVAPAIMRAIEKANEGFAASYGDDVLTARVSHRFSDVFERDVAVYFVPTGTAANALAIAHVSLTVSAQTRGGSLPVEGALLPQGYSSADDPFCAAHCHSTRVGKRRPTNAQYASASSGVTRFTG